MLTNTTILKKLKELQPTFEKENIKLLGLFGSYARNEAKENSDIDILIETSPEFLKKYVGWDAIVKLDELKDILKNIFKKEIDFADKQGLIEHKNTHILKKTMYV